LSARQPLFGDILEQSNYRKYRDFNHQEPHLNNTKQLVNRGNTSPQPILVGNALGGINFASGTKQFVAQELRFGLGQV
jgi:hypothetical protein